MPFSPLPATFLEDLERAGPPGVLELGSGDGQLTALLSAAGFRPWTLDHAAPQMGVCPDVRGDALRPPFRGRFGVVVAGNLLRHLWPRVVAAGPRPWADLVGPGGALWILEDEPALDDPRGTNYACLQQLLCGLVPGRQPLLALASFRAARSGWGWGGTWYEGCQPNRWVLDARRISAWLGAGKPASGGDVARLRAAIDRQGIACVRSWWARWQPEERE
jgi:SAM-dependent methyltransferase